MTGKTHGRRPWGSRPTEAWGIGVFLDEEGGSTSVTVAVALLASLALVFTLAQGVWVGSRSGDVQAVADAAALSAMAPVKSFRTVAQVADATVLSLGLTGLLMMGAGAVTALVPGFGAAGMKVVEAGQSVLDSRRHFAESAAQGLKKLEKGLPAAMAAQSWSVVQANATEAVPYNGLAMPFPAEGASTYDLADDVAESAKALAEKAEAMAKASDAAKEKREIADEALREGWHADCVDDPSCAYSRACALSALPGMAVPRYAHPEGWDFSVALKRAQEYYAARLNAEWPESDDPEEWGRSKMREAYFQYAKDTLENKARIEDTGYEVSVSFPELAHDAGTTRDSLLYDEVSWPCTLEPKGRTVHAWPGCPGATGGVDGEATIKETDGGKPSVLSCETCHLGFSRMSIVANACYNTETGFEHYWAQIVEASKKWAQAENDAREANRAAKEAAESGADLFDKAIQALAVPRPQLRPPGYLGTIALVARPSSSAPSSLVTAFSGEATLPAGCAIAGACLAPEEATSQENVLARFFDSVSHGQEAGVGTVLQGIVGLWGELLMGYGKAYGSVSKAADKLFDGLDAVGGSTVATWLKEKVGALVAAAGFEPADLRLRKPVLCNTQDILSADGSTTAADLRRYLEAMPADGTPAQLLASFGRSLKDELGDKELTLAELTIPGTTIKVPFKVKVKTLWGAP